MRSIRWSYQYDRPFPARRRLCPAPGGGLPEKSNAMPTKIELIADGDGGVMVFIDGAFSESFNCEYGIPERLEKLLCKHITKYPPPALPYTWR